MFRGGKKKRKKIGRGIFFLTAFADKGVGGRVSNVGTKVGIPIATSTDWTFTTESNTAGGEQRSRSRSRSRSSSHGSRHCGFSGDTHEMVEGIATSS